MVRRPSQQQRQSGFFGGTYNLLLPLDRPLAGKRSVLACEVLGHLGRTLFQRSNALQDMTEGSKEAKPSMSPHSSNQQFAMRACQRNPLAEYHGHCKATFRPLSIKAIAWAAIKHTPELAAAQPVGSAPALCSQAHPQQPSHPTQSAPALLPARSAALAASQCPPGCSAKPYSSACSRPAAG